MNKERRAHERVPVVMLGVTFRSIYLKMGLFQRIKLFNSILLDK